VKARSEEGTIQHENFYHACLYDVLQHQSADRVEGVETVNRFTAKIVKLYRARLARVIVEMPNQDMLLKETMSLFRVIKRRQRQEQRIITKVQDLVDGAQTTTTGFINVFSSLKQKFRTILVDDVCFRQMAEVGHQFLSEAWK
jgi:hypothetical protein